MRGQAREDNSTDERKARINQRGKRKGGAGGRKDRGKKRRQERDTFSRNPPRGRVDPPCSGLPLKGSCLF